MDKDIAFPPEQALGIRLNVIRSKISNITTNGVGQPSQTVSTNDKEDENNPLFVMCNYTVPFQASQLPGLHAVLRLFSLQDNDSSVDIIPRIESKVIKSDKEFMSLTAQNKIYTTMSDSHFLTRLFKPSYTDLNLPDQADKKFYDGMSALTDIFYHLTIPGSHLFLNDTFYRPITNITNFDVTDNTNIQQEYLDFVKSKAFASEIKDYVATFKKSLEGKHTLAGYVILVPCAPKSMLSGETKVSFAYSLIPIKKTGPKETKDTDELMKSIDNIMSANISFNKAIFGATMQGIFTFAFGPRGNLYAKNWRAMYDAATTDDDKIKIANLLKSATMPFNDEKYTIPYHLYKLIHHSRVHGRSFMGSQTLMTMPMYTTDGSKIHSYDDMKSSLDSKKATWVNFVDYFSKIYPKDSSHVTQYGDPLGDYHQKDISGDLDSDALEEIIRSDFTKVNFATSEKERVSAFVLQGHKDLDIEDTLDEESAIGEAFKDVKDMKFSLPVVENAEGLQREEDEQVLNE